MCMCVMCMYIYVYVCLYIMMTSHDIMLIITTYTILVYKKEDVCTQTDGELNKYFY